MTRRWLAACVALAAGALGIMSTAQAEDKPILIGFAVGLTGWIAPFDTGYKSAEIAIDEINAKGGLLGRKLVTAFCDTKADREQGAKCGQEMVEKGADFIVVTCDYDFGGPAALSAARAGKISWALCAEDPKMGVQGIGPLAFSGAEAAQLQGSGVAEWGVAKKGWKTGYILIELEHRVRQVGVLRVRSRLQGRGRQDCRSGFVQERRSVNRDANYAA